MVPQSDLHARCLGHAQKNPNDLPLKTNLCNSVCRGGQNRIYTPYMTIYLVISLPELLYKYRI